MSEQRPQSEPGDAVSDAEPGGGVSSNGTYAEFAVAVAEEPQDDATATAEPPDAGIAEPTVSDMEPAADDATAFLAQLVQAMQATAGAERHRIEVETGRRLEEHLAAIDVRRESEVDTMRELAAADLKSIDAWAEDERNRIELERERRAAALQEDLESSLAEHGSKLDREVEGIDAAIAAYRIEVEAFFATLEQETDPVAIAQHASKRPQFPSLETVAADTPASSDSASEAASPAVGVMDPSTSADLAESWARWNEGSGPVGEAETPADPVSSASGEDAIQPVTITAAEQPAIGSVLRSVPVSRPAGWFDRYRGDHANGEG